MGPTGNSRVVQIHPTRRCNLRCLHCYSSSGPEERAELPAALLRDALDDASGEGYNVASFSGGEPTLYKPLRTLLEHARSLGLFTTVTSNGMLLDSRRLSMLEGAVDLLAISLDGVPASHNRMRADRRAFEAMAGNLQRIRDSGIPFGFIFTLTQYNLNELDWVANFALEQGATLLQTHPLEDAGRAVRLLRGQVPDEIESSFALLAVARIQAIVGSRLAVQLDFVNRDYVRSRPERLFADESGAREPKVPLAELVAPLVIEADGTVVPLRYGFAREFAFGNLTEAPLGELTALWRRDRYERFRKLCRLVFEELTAPAELPLTNWYELIARRAEQLSLEHVGSKGQPLLIRSALSSMVPRS
jgi:MoaA/NifB/PqqE/SkfB family radical SAM enzyme